MCSTFKFLAAALVLSRLDQRQEPLNRRIAAQASDIVPYSPATLPRVGGVPMALAELCDAAVTLSDNPAANLLLKTFGGPQGLTVYTRSLGNEFTRLDRIEPDLNEATPGDPRDTTTPDAMLKTMQKIVIGPALSPASREQITRWLIDNKTGDKKLRAGPAVTVSDALQTTKAERYVPPIPMCWYGKTLILQVSLLDSPDFRLVCMRCRDAVAAFSGYIATDH